MARFPKEAIIFEGHEGYLVEGLGESKWSSPRDIWLDIRSLPSGFCSLQPIDWLRPLTPAAREMLSCVRNANKMKG